MVLPLEADVLYALRRNGNLILEKIVWVVCFLVVLIPFLASVRRFRCSPGKWRGKLALVLTACVLAWNVIFAIVLWSHKTI